MSFLSHRLIFLAIKMRLYDQDSRNPMRSTSLDSKKWSHPRTYLPDPHQVAVPSEESNDEKEKEHVEPDTMSKTSATTVTQKNIDDDRLIDNGFLFDIDEEVDEEISMTSSSTFLLGLASTGIMGIGGFFIMDGKMTYGEFVSFTLFLGFMIAPIVQMSNIGSQLTEAMAGLDRT